ncbi:MAG: T9SS type A sorting domain-containing protein [Salinivirgaceae bacterium]|nr:T9SS type A sorting domain-containing protein [Salinivirgaceae bacterium]
MQKLITFCLLAIITSTAAFAQDKLTTLEYWIDNNINDKIAVDISNSNLSSYTFSQTVSIDNLSAGLHMLNFRAKGANAFWSVIQSSFFSSIGVASSNSIVGYEYWFNNNVENSVYVASTEQSITNSIDVSALQPGLNLFNFRTLNSQGVWSIVQSHFFSNTPTTGQEPALVKAYKHWINDSIETLIYVELDNPINPYELLTQIETPILSVGTHMFSIQFQDTYNHWSTVQSANFQVTTCGIAKANKPIGDALSCADEQVNAYETFSVNKANSYLWNITPDTAAAIESSDTSAIVIWNELFFGEAKLCVAAQNSCGLGENSDSLIIVRSVLPEKPLIAEANFYEFCDTDSIALTAPEGYSYLWQDYSDNQSFTANYSGEYYVRIMNNAGCFSYSDTITVETHETPNTPSIMAYGDTEFCSGDSVEIGVNNLPKDSFYQLWTTGETTETIWVTASGEFAHKLISDFGCESEFSDSIKVTVFENPATPTISRIDNTLTSSEAYSYQWYHDLAPVAGLVPIDNATEQNFTPVENGIYAVEVMNENGCLNFSDPLEVILTGIDLINQTEISIYPNPNQGIFILSLPSELANSQIVIFDISGKTVASKQIDGLTYNFSLNVKSGIYYAKITNNKQLKTIQIQIN